MATDPIAPPPVASAPALAAQPVAPPPASASRREVVVFRHSSLFYWWPVWLLGFLFAALTYFGDYHMAVVPGTTTAAKDRKVELDDGTQATRNVLILPENAKLVEHRNLDGESEIIQPKIYMSPRRTYGTLFAIVLLLVIGITNVPMRGLWSVLVLLVIVGLSVIFAVAGWWEAIFAHLSQLSIHINLGGYLLISTALFTLWIVNFLFFDRQIYMIFNPGQVRVRLEVGGGETVFDTTGMVVQKHRGDLFRHWILGFGSGDLDIRPVGVANPIELPNVMRISRVVKEIETLIKEKVMVKASDKK